MDALNEVPDWVLRQLPAHAIRDDVLERQLAEMLRRLPNTLAQMNQILNQVRNYREYDSAVNHACARVWRKRETLLTHRRLEVRQNLLMFAARHMTERARARIYRRLLKDKDRDIRRQVLRLVGHGQFSEVALPLQENSAWNTNGWLHGSSTGPLRRHQQGQTIQARHGLPQLGTVGELRQFLGIHSERQLGYFLLASDHKNGPYTRFTIPKRGGGKRAICAPKKQLLRVQRQILDKILAKIPVHRSAHGFIPGRSTVTNALPHRGAHILLKFDLTDFFPTIHFYRVVGLFTRLGYTAYDASFESSDESQQVAPTLARLCCHTPNPRLWNSALLPQGAPTSPAITNLICRRLDARLDGLARRKGGIYTRYADDLTFSFRQTTVELGRFRWWVDQICYQEGFILNPRKFRVVRASQRQLVTGLVVNEELRIPRDVRRRFRAILHNCRQHGIATQANGHPRFADYLRGFASYVHMVHPEEGTELLRQVEELLGSEPTAGEDEE